MKPVIWIVDTSVFLNVLKIPGRSQNQDQIFSEFEERLLREDTFLLPYAAIVETGNFIAQLEGNYKYEFAGKFIENVRQAIDGSAPWKPLKFPTIDVLSSWLESFPDFASRGISFGDFSIIKEWEEQRGFFKAYSVRIWSLDQGLQGYES